MPCLGLTSTKRRNPTGSGQDKANLFAFQADATTSTGAAAGPAAGGGAHISPETMNALLAAQSQASRSQWTPTSRSDALKDLFGKIDADGDGKITKNEFEKALGAGGTNPQRPTTCSASSTRTATARSRSDEMSSALKGGRGHHGHHHMAGVRR